MRSESSSCLRGLCVAVAAFWLASAAAGDANEPESANEPAAAPAATSAPATRGEASESIDQLHGVLLDVMKNAQTLGYDGRATKLTPVIPRHFDVAFMAEKAVGAYWKKATETERKRYLEAFLRFMIANYAGQFDGWTGQSFQTLGEEPARMETRIVRTKLIDPTDEDVELNYRMHNTPEGWKIIDVYLDGNVSELALRRSEFSGIVKRENFDALIAALDAKIAKLSSGKAS